MFAVNGKRAFMTWALKAVMSRIIIDGASQMRANRGDTGDLFLLSPNHPNGADIFVVIANIGVVARSNQLNPNRFTNWEVLQFANWIASIRLASPRFSTQRRPDITQSR